MSLTAPAPRSPLPAIAWMVAAVACFSLMDAGMKLLSASYPPLQVTLLRGAASLPFVLVWVFATAGPRAIIPVRWGLHLLRGVLGMVMIGCFVYGLKRMPLSTAYTLYFVAPLLVAALSVPLLGEHVGPRRWTAIAIGLVGVIVVLRPGVNGLISLPGLMVLLAATAYAIAAITVSLLTRTDTPQAMVVWFLLFMAIGAGLLAVPDWVPLRAEHAWLIAGMGLARGVGAGGADPGLHAGRGLDDRPARIHRAGLGDRLGLAAVADPARRVDLDRRRHHRRQRPVFVAPGADPAGRQAAAAG